MPRGPSRLDHLALSAYLRGGASLGALLGALVWLALPLPVVSGVVLLPELGGVVPAGGVVPGVAAGGGIVSGAGVVGLAGAVSGVAGVGMAGVVPLPVPGVVVAPEPVVSGLAASGALRQAPSRPLISAAVRMTFEVLDKALMILPFFVWVSRAYSGGGLAAAGKIAIPG